MSVRLTMIRRSEVLVPAAQMFLDDLKKIPEGTTIVVEWKKVRSVPHHRRFFAKLRKLCQAAGWDKGEKTLLEYIKIGTGHVITVIDNTSSMVPAAMLALAEEVMKSGPLSPAGKLAQFVISLAGPKSYLIPKSIGFEEMDETEFGDFEKRADAFIAEKWGLDPELLMQEAADLLLGPGDYKDVSGKKPDAGGRQSLPPPEPIGALLRGLAEALHKPSLDAVNATWKEIRVQDATISLYRRAERQVKGILDAARKDSTGFFATASGFDEIVGKVIAEAEDKKL